MPSGKEMSSKNVQLTISWMRMQGCRSTLKRLDTKSLIGNQKNWWAPNERDLTAVQQFLPGWPEQYDRDEYTGNIVQKLYFSAAAVAIRFLKRVTPQTRSQLRIIALEEDHPSILDPHTHAQGLVQFL
jgi:hypothetical protein